MQNNTLSSENQKNDDSSFSLMADDANDLRATTDSSFNKSFEVDMQSLNNTICIKEVMLCYLGAAILEPVLAIAGSESVEGDQLVLNLLMLSSICWWIWLITDAFDCANITQQFKFGVEFREDKDNDASNYKWLKLRPRVTNILETRKNIGYSFIRNISVWVLILSIVAAFIPAIGIDHRDVVHAYFILFFWIILHYSVRCTTTWGTGYIWSLLFPSTILMPLEYCLPLMDTLDFAGDIQAASDYVDFVQKRIGANLIVIS